MRHAFHLAQILRAQATRSQVSSRSVVSSIVGADQLFVWLFADFPPRAKVQNFVAHSSSSELSAHQMAPGGVIPHWRSLCAHEPPSSSMLQVWDPRCRERLPAFAETLVVSPDEPRCTDANSLRQSSVDVERPTCSQTARPSRACKNDLQLRVGQKAHRPCPGNVQIVLLSKSRVGTAVIERLRFIRLWM